MDFSSWAKNAMLALGTISLSQLTFIQLDSGGIPMMESAVIIACWLLVCSMAYSLGRPESSEIIIPVKTKERLAAVAESIRSIPLHSSTEEDQQSCYSTDSCYYSTDYQDEPETTVTQLLSLHEQKDYLTQELSASWLALEFQENVKRAAMEYYFGSLQGGTDNREIGLTAYRMARGRYTKMLRSYREKQWMKKNIFEEIEMLERMQILEMRRESSEKKDLDERRCSGDTLFEAPVGRSYREQGFLVM